LEQKSGGRYSDRATQATKAPMATYRAFFVNAENHIIGRRDFEAADDCEALSAAEQLADVLLIEVWCGENFVGTVNRKHAKRRDMSDTEQQLHTKN
jgi:hypothetical protein